MTPIRKTLALCGLALGLGIVTACSNTDDITQDGQGAVRFVMSAAAETPVPLAATGPEVQTTDRPLQAANVTFSSIVARNLDGQLIDVTIALPVTVDLIGLGTEGTYTLPAGFLPPGTYDQIIIVITKVSVTLADDTIVTIEPPGGGWTAVLNVREPFDVVDGQTTTVDIEFRRGALIRFLNGVWEFHPDFECTGHHGEHDSDRDSN